MDILKTAEFALSQLIKNGADKAAVSVGKSEKEEFNVDLDRLTLLRSVAGYAVSLTVIKDYRKAAVSINYAGKKDILSAAGQVVEMAKQSKPDAAHDISPLQPVRHFDNGVKTADLNKMYGRFAEFIDEAKRKYPQIIFGTTVLDFSHADSVYLNSNGVKFTQTGGEYGFFSMFNAKDGNKISSFNHSDFSFKNIDKPFIDCAEFDDILNETVLHLNPQKIPEKFEGDLLLSPQTTGDFLDSYFSATLGDYPLITNTSIFKGMLGKQIASPLLTARSMPVSDEIQSGYYITSDGFIAENEPLIENGILKSYQLGLYGANKTGLARAKSSGGALAVNAGDKPLKEIISSVKKGILVRRFSGGEPSADTSFSGIAKNSFYIENGKIMYPICETMISANIAEMFRNLKAVSKERADFGSAVLPWLLCPKATIS